MTAKKTASVWDRSEIADAIRGLSPADWSRLRAVAATYALSRPIEAEDLLQEAFRRALDGGRNCPTHVDVVKFLAEAMRSIAHGEVEKRGRQSEVVALSSHGEMLEGLVDPPDPKPLAAEQIEFMQRAAAIKSAILAVFDDDPVAQVLVEGLMEGMQGEQLKDLVELDVTKYRSKRKLIRRRIAKNFPEGWKP